MVVRSTIEWPNGDITKRDVDFEDGDEKARFAMVAAHALQNGARVTTVAVEHLPIWRGGAKSGPKFVIT